MCNMAVLLRHVIQLNLIVDWPARMFIESVFGYLKILGGRTESTLKISTGLAWTPEPNQV